MLPSTYKQQAIINLAQIYPHNTDLEEADEIVEQCRIVFGNSKAMVRTRLSNLSSLKILLIPCRVYDPIHCSYTVMAINLFPDNYKQSNFFSMAFYLSALYICANSILLHS